jgi:hypothetical protein
MKKKAGQRLIQQRTLMIKQVEIGGEDVDEVNSN